MLRLLIAGASLLWSTGSRGLGFSSRSSWAEWSRLMGSSTQAQLSRTGLVVAQMGLVAPWALPSLGIESVSPALERQILYHWTGREGFSLIHSFTWHFFMTPCVPRPVQKMTGQGKKKQTDSLLPFFAVSSTQVI